MAGKDPLKALKDVGIDTEKMPAGQRKVLTELSPEELATLIRIHQRMAATTDVEGYATPTAQATVRPAAPKVPELGFKRADGYVVY